MLFNDREQPVGWMYWIGRESIHGAYVQTSSKADQTESNSGCATFKVCIQRAVM